MYFEMLLWDDEAEVVEMSEMATTIIKDYYDPIIGPEQNDYMIKMFQSVDALKEQLEKGYRYYFIREDDRNIGFVAFYPRDKALYLSKLYLYKDERGKGYAKGILDFLKTQASELGLSRIELNVNKHNVTRFIYEKLGFEIAWAEKNDIGNGFYMDDYVYALEF